MVGSLNPTTSNTHVDVSYWDKFLEAFSESLKNEEELRSILGEIEVTVSSSKTSKLSKEIKEIFDGTRFSDSIIGLKAQSRSKERVG